MSTPENGYTINSQVHINQLNGRTGQVESGWEISVYDKITGSIVPVFVPDTVYGEDQARTLIEHALSNVRKVHALGS